MTIQTDGINKDSYGNKEIQEGRLVYAADAESTDTYVVSLQPAATQMVTGMVINFYCNTANTGAATLNVNGLGAKTIKKFHDQDLATGDIEAGQIITVVYDGTVFQMQSQTGAMNFASVDIDGGTIDGTAIGSTTPAAGHFSPSVSKGPAIITTFAGTVTATASTTVTFSSAADAILCGYNATNPVLGATLISNALTRYIVSWTNATTAVVDSAVTWAGTAITSVQLPISSEATSAGVLKKATFADGTEYFVGSIGIAAAAPKTKLHIVPPATSTIGTSVGLNIADTAGDIGRLAQIGLGYNDGSQNNFPVVIGSRGTSGTNASNAGFFVATRSATTDTAATEVFFVDPSGNILTGGLTSAGTSAVKMIYSGTATMPTAVVADAAAMGPAEYNGGTGDVRWNFYGEASVAAKTAVGSGKVSINGAVTSGGGYTRQLAEAVSAALSGASGSIAVNVPSGARILGVQLRVDTAITSGDGATSWTAAYVNTPTTAICSGQAFAKSTKFNAIHPAYEITTGTVTISITPNSNTFSGGVVRAIVYFESIDAMADAP